MKKKTLAISLWIVLFIPSLVGVSVAADCDEQKEFCGGGILSFTGGEISVKNLSLEMRNVPVHADDSFAAKNAGPITDAGYDVNGTFEIGGNFSRRYNRLRVGAGVKWMIALADDAKRNYTNAVGTSERGYGAALTYVTLAKKGILLNSSDSLVYYILNLTPEVFVEAVILEKPSLALGCSLSYFNLQAVNGWDRYDKNEINEYYSLGHYVPVSVYLKIFATDLMDVAIGANYPVKLSETADGKEADIQRRLTWFVAARF